MCRPSTQTGTWQPCDGTGSPHPPPITRSGIKVSDEVEAGAAEYVRLRAGWDAPVNGLGSFLGYARQQIDVSTAHGKN